MFLIYKLLFLVLLLSLNLSQFSSLPSWTLGCFFLDNMGKMAVGFSFNLLSKYIHGCGLILLHRKERGPCKQVGKREEPGHVDQE